MKNKELNRIKKQRAEKSNKKFWYKRIGKCNPNFCAGACCRYNAHCSPKDRDYFNGLIDFSRASLFEIQKGRKDDLVVRNVICPHMTMNARCKLHNKKSQPSICDIFPMYHDDNVYRAVRKYCGFNFIKVKNPKYSKMKNKIKKGEN